MFGQIFFYFIFVFFIRIITLKREGIKIRKKFILKSFILLFQSFNP